jgi:2-methylcitrate dehydratase PrpD
MAISGCVDMAALEDLLKRREQLDLEIADAEKAGDGRPGDRGEVKAITAELADFALAPCDFPGDVRAAGIRSFVNIVGCALGGAHHPASALAFEINREFAGAPAATLVGRGRSVDVLGAAYLNALAASAHAFDDTHLSTVLHPAAPVASALFALVDRQRVSGEGGAPISGEAFLEAFTLGIEIQCRLGVALLLPPAEGQVGWYASGIAGGVSAAGSFGGTDALGHRDRGQPGLRLPANPRQHVH